MKPERDIRGSLTNEVLMGKNSLEPEEIHIDRKKKKGNGLNHKRTKHWALGKSCKQNQKVGLSFPREKLERE